MVRTEANMIISRINHHYIIHQQGIIYNILNLLNFSMKRNYEVPSITTMMIIKMEGCFMIDKGGSLILTLLGEADF